MVRKSDSVGDRDDGSDFVESLFLVELAAIVQLLRMIP